MATTVYTYNDKVLKNVATDKWLKKPDAQEGYTKYNTVNKDTTKAIWQSPTFPDAYTPESGHKLNIKVNNNIAQLGKLRFQYWTSADLPSGSFNAPVIADLEANTGAVILQGNYELNMATNPAGSPYGIYISLELTLTGGYDHTYDPVEVITDIDSLLDNIEITIS